MSWSSQRSVGALHQRSSMTGATTHCVGSWWRQISRDHRVDEVAVVDSYDDLVTLGEAVDPAEVVAVGAAVAGDGEAADAAGLGGHVVVAGPALVET